MQPIHEIAIRALTILNERGGYASDHLSELIRREQLAPKETALVSELVYGVLRNERKLALALAHAGSNDPRPSPRDLLSAFLVMAHHDFSSVAAEDSHLDFNRVLEIADTCAQVASVEQRVALAGSLPDWLAETLIADFGAEAEELARSLSAAPPRSLRANTLCVSREELADRLKSEGVETVPGTLTQNCLNLAGATNPFRTRAFSEGLFELQDEASQLVCEIVAPPPRGLVIDLCAGAGGKTLGLAALLKGAGRIVACDVAAPKLAELKKRARRAKAHNIETRTIAPEAQQDTSLSDVLGRADRVLVDAPCTGTGVLRRNPEARRTLDRAALERLSETQRQIVEQAAPLVAVGGRLLYATCSLLKREGEEVADYIATRLPEFEPVNLASIYGRAWIERFSRPKPHTLRTLPHVHGTDGFFVACFRRRR